MSQADATTAAPQAPAGRARLQWVDAVRGYSVAMVVLAHVVLWHVAQPGVAVDHLGSATWARVYGVLGSVRMPVLLAVSGLVVARRVRAGFRDGGLALRSARNYYLYVVWLLVYAAFYAVVRDADLPHRVHGPLDVVRQLVVPGTTLWYVYALAVYIAVLGALHRVRPWLVLTVLAVVSVAFHATTGSEDVWTKVPELAVFFAIGVYGAGALRRLAERASVPLVLAVAAAGVAVTACGRFTAGHPVAGGVLSLARGTVFLVLAVVVVAVGVRWSPVRRLGLALGRRTLPIYVLHPLLIALVIVATGSFAHHALGTVLGARLGALLYPPLLAALVIALCLLFHAGVRRVGLEVPLFAMPATWAARLDGVPAPPPEPGVTSAAASGDPVADRTVGGSA